MKKLVLSIVFATIMISAYSQKKEKMIRFNPNFVHSVYFWLNNPDSEADRQAFETALKKLLKNSKYTKTNYIGTAPRAIRDVVDDSFTYKLIVTFESAEEQELYQNEKAHLLFIEEAKDLWNKVLVYDAVELPE